MTTTATNLTANDLSSIFASISVKPLAKLGSELLGDSQRSLLQRGKAGLVNYLTAGVIGAWESGVLTVEARDLLAEATGIQLVLDKNPRTKPTKAKKAEPQSDENPWEQNAYTTTSTTELVAGLVADKIEQVEGVRRQVAEQDAAKKTERKSSGRQPAFAADDMIHLKVEGNPKREGTASYERFALYREEGMTVQQALDAGVTRADLRHDTLKGFIEIGA